MYKVKILLLFHEMKQFHCDMWSISSQDGRCTLTGCLFLALPSQERCYGSPLWEGVSLVKSFFKFQNLKFCWILFIHNLAHHVLASSECEIYEDFCLSYFISGMEIAPIWRLENVCCLLPKASFGHRVLSLPASVCVCLSMCVSVSVNHLLVPPITRDGRSS